MSYKQQINWALNDPDATVIIEAVSNGFRVTRFSRYDDSNEVYSIDSVIESQEPDSIRPDFEAVEKLLWRILEDLEIYNSKHYGKRLNIEVVDQGCES